MANDAATRVRSIAEKVLEADVTDQIAQRGRELSAAVGEATDAVSARAMDAWRDSASTRQEAEKLLRRTGEDAARWSRRTWAKELQPTVRRLWSQRALALGAAGAAIPAGRELVEDAAVRMGIRKRQEERHWATFFLGIVIGAAIGAIVALLTTPKPGREMRDELATQARDAAVRTREVAEKAAERAKDAAGGAGEWVPLFQRDEDESQVAESGADEPGDAPTEGADEG